MLFSIILSALPAFTLAHGYLSSPPPRGIEKTAYAVDALKSPNFGRQTCRGEPAGQITQVGAGSSITLDFTITAPHIGPCEVYLLDLDLDASKQVKIAEKRDCAAPGKVEPWTVKLPAGVSGRKVLRWYWEGQHIGIPGEPYEQCVDLMIGAGSGGDDSYPVKAKAQGAPRRYRQPPRRRPSLRAAPVKAAAPRAAYPKESASAADEEEEEEEEAYAPEEEEYASDEEAAPEEEYASEAAAAAPEGEYTTEENAAPEEQYASEEDDAIEAEAEAADESAYGEVSDAATQPAAEEYSPSGSGCQHGKYVCDEGPNFAICSNDVWVKQSCGAGQTCKPVNGSISCVLASTQDKY